MFTGIIQALVPIASLTTKPGLLSFALSLPPRLQENLSLGASIAIDGVCLTVTSVNNGTVTFDVMQETLTRTTLGTLTVGQNVNVERSATMGTEIGGHIVSGHVSCTAEIVAVSSPENNHAVTFQVPKEWMKYIFTKGFIALDGASLTVVDVNKTANTFSVWFIPETLRMTTFGTKDVGDRVNVEVDSRTQTIVETVENYLREHAS